MKTNHAVTKSNKYVKKTKNTLFYKKVREFLRDEIEVINAKQVTQILNQLHEIDYENIYDKNFTLTYKNLKKDRNMSYFDYDIETEEQNIVITNNWKKSSSNTIKKCTILDAYFHELMHEKQRDFALISENMKVKSAFLKTLNVEIMQNAYVPYELKLCEIEARMEATRRNVDLIKKGILKSTPETLFNSLSNIDDILFSFNRFKVFNGEIEFDIDKFIKRYFASLKLAVIKDKEDEETYSFLSSDSFKLKFRFELNKKLEAFKKDIEYVYSQLLDCYKMNKKMAQKLNLTGARLDAFMENMKDFKCNDYYLNIIYKDLSDRYYLRKNKDKININERKHLELPLDTEIGE